MRTPHLIFDCWNTTAVLTKTSLAPQDKLKTSSLTEDRQGFHLHTSGVEPRDLLWCPRVPDRAIPLSHHPLGVMLTPWVDMTLSHSVVSSSPWPQPEKQNPKLRSSREGNENTCSETTHTQHDVWNWFTIYHDICTDFISLWQCVEISMSRALINTCFVTSQEDVTGNSAMILHRSTNHKQEGEDPKPKKNERKRRKQK